MLSLYAYESVRYNNIDNSHAYAMYWDNGANGFTTTAQYDWMLVQVQVCGLVGGYAGGWVLSMDSVCNTCFWCILG